MECTEKFRKDCFIEYRNELQSERLKSCRQSWGRRCNEDNEQGEENGEHHTWEEQGKVEEVCSTAYETGELNSLLRNSGLITR